MSIPSAPRGISRPVRRAMAVGAVLGGLLAWPSLSKLMEQTAFALLLSAAGLPLCRRMEKRLPRAWAAGGALGVLMLGLAGMIGLLLPHMITQISLAAAEAPRLMERAQAAWDSVKEQEWAKLLGMDGKGPGEWMGATSQWMVDSLPSLIAGIGSGIDFLSRAFLSPVLAYYFLKDRESFSYRLSLWIPLRHRKRVLTAIQEMRREAGGYVRGQSLVALVVAAMTGLGLLIMGIPAWMALGMLMGACEWIPYVGPLIGGIPILLFSLPQGVNTMLWCMGITILVQQVEGYFLSPRLMAGATGLHPVYVLLLLSAGGLLAGLPGMVAAVPCFVCLRGAARVIYETREEGGKECGVRSEE